MERNDEEQKNRSNKRSHRANSESTETARKRTRLQIKSLESSRPGTPEFKSKTAKCPICLQAFTTQMIGTPESCSHNYCLTCILTWSQRLNNCPLDRIPYSKVLLREIPDGVVLGRVAIPDASPYLDYIDLIQCFVCGSLDRDNEMLLCDSCDRGFHIDCLTPPLSAVPQLDEWYCPDCEAQEDLEEEPDVEEVPIPRRSVRIAARRVDAAVPPPQSQRGRG